MAIDEERANNERLLRIYRRNLQRLLEQKATYGIGNTPIALENQIDETRAQIALYEPLAPTQSALNTAQSISPSIDLTTLYIQGTQIAAEQARQADQNKAIIEQQVRDALWRLQAKEVIEEVVQRVAAAETVSQTRYDQELMIRKDRQQETDERHTLIELALDTIGPQVTMLSRRVSWVRWIAIAVLIVVVVALIFALRVL